MPSVNSFLVNSHCVAALNFQAIKRTLRLAGSNLRSSQNRPMPSAMILSSSVGSSVKSVQFNFVSNENSNMMSEKYSQNRNNQMLMWPPCHYGYFVLAQTKAQSVFFLFKEIL